MKQSLRIALILIICLTLSFSAVLATGPAVRAAVTGTWTPVSTGFTNMNVWVFAIDRLAPTTLYIGTSGGVIFCTTDSGTTWTAANVGPTNRNVLASVFHPATSSIL